MRVGRYTFWNSRALEGALWSGNLKARGVSDLEFPEGTDKSVFLKNTYFINFTSSQVKHERTTLLPTVEACMQDTRQQEKTGIQWLICFHVYLIELQRPYCHKTSSFLLWKQLHKILCPSNSKLHWPFGWACHFDFLLTLMVNLAWISSDQFESLLLPQLLRGENNSK